MKTKIKWPNSVLFASALKIGQRYSHLLSDSGADPWIIQHRGWYYYCRVVDDWQITVSRAKRLEDISINPKAVWQSPVGDCTAEVWAPELHYLNRRWYIYFTQGAGEKHRMYVLEAKTGDPQGAYALRGKLADSSDKWAIDGTILQRHNQLYLLWSGWEGDANVRQNLYIAKMRNPWTISSPRVCIAVPQYTWEKATNPELPDVNEAPQVLRRHGKIFIIYSASHSLTADYCLGQLTLIGPNPLLAESWQKKPSPVFCKSDDILAPGHASFIKQGGYDWIIYHSAKYPDAGWDRQVLAQKFRWRADGSPDFTGPLPQKSRLFARWEAGQLIKAGLFNTI